MFCTIDNNINVIRSNFPIPRGLPPCAYYYSCT